MYVQIGCRTSQINGTDLSCINRNVFESEQAITRSLFHNNFDKPESPRYRRVHATRISWKPRDIYTEEIHVEPSKLSPLSAYPWADFTESVTITAPQGPIWTGIPLLRPTELTPPASSVCASMLNRTPSTPFTARWGPIFCNLSLFSRL